MWYEGYGGGRARTEPYGSFLKGGKSQIGLATLSADYFYVDPRKSSFAGKEAPYEGAENP